MPRPRKPAAELRRRWDALHVTAAERAEITAAARQAGRSVSRYLVEAHRGTAPRGPRDTGVLIAPLARAERHLADLAHQVRAGTGPVEAVLLQANLLAIERQFRQAVLPWSLVLDGAAAEEDPC
jgi:hypothetical protein